MATSKDLSQQLRDMLGKVKTLRDEIRVDLHLAGLEARNRWQNELEPRLQEAESFVRDVTDASRTALTDIVERYQVFRNDLRMRSEKEEREAREEHPQS